MSNTYSINDGKLSIIKKIFIQYWKWDRMPSYTIEDTSIIVEENTPEDLLLSMYDEYKSEVLASYPWRSAQVYTKITTSEPVTSNDKRYKYRANCPENFLIANGFWLDEERRMDCPNSVDIVGKEIRTNLKEFTMGWVNSTKSETELDSWVLDYMATYMASSGSDIGGCNPDTKNFLLQKVEFDYQSATNRDYHMAHKDEISDSIHQFEFSY